LHLPSMEGTIPFFVRHPQKGEPMDGFHFFLFFLWYFKDFQFETFQVAPRTEFTRAITISLPNTINAYKRKTFNNELLLAHSIEAFHPILFSTKIGHSSTFIAFLRLNTYLTLCFKNRTTFTHLIKQDRRL